MQETEDHLFIWRMRIIQFRALSYTRGVILAPFLCVAHPRVVSRCKTEKFRDETRDEKLRKHETQGWKKSPEIFTQRRTQSGGPLASSGLKVQHLTRCDDVIEKGPGKLEGIWHVKVKRSERVALNELRGTCFAPLYAQYMYTIYAKRASLRND